MKGKITLLLLVFSLLINLILATAVNTLNGKANIKMLKKVTYNGLRFKYPSGWQIIEKVSNIDFPSERIYINIERDHTWGPFGTNTDFILDDSVVKDQKITAESTAKSVYDEYKSNRVGIGDGKIKPVILSEIISPKGLKMWKLEGNEMTENAPNTIYVFEYEEVKNQTNINTVEKLKHIV